VAEWAFYVKSATAFESTLSSSIVSYRICIAEFARSER